jgi:signal transduction histidine kinase
VASLFLASALGYGVARAGLAPVEEMRRKAQSISLSGSPALLPLPPARDQLRRLGDTLNDMLHRLRDAFDRERRFVADASHEIRTPLATVRLELVRALCPANSRTASDGLRCWPPTPSAAG